MADVSKHIVAEAIFSEPSCSGEATTASHLRLLKQFTCFATTLLKRIRRCSKSGATISMMRAVSIAAVGTLIPALLLYLWKVSYVLSDLAGIWLLFIGVLIFLGNRRLVLERWRAERRVVLREGSWVSMWMTGGVWAVVSSALLVAILIPALAWHALTMPSDVAGILCALAFASGALFLAMRAFLMRHFMPPFDRVFASGPST